SVDKDRQEGPHVHGVYMHPSKDLLYVTDLGTDQVVTYPIHTDSDEPLDVAAKNVYKVTPGDGPRHIVIHEGNQKAYLVKEMAGKLEVLNVNDSGKLSHMAEYKLHDDTFSGKNQGSEVRITPDGRFIYVTNRGDADTISAFKINDDGSLSPISLVKSGGDTPRNFVVSPNGQYVVVGHQDSHDIHCFHRDTTDGSLGKANKLIETGAPVHFLWIKK
ncbi:MAG: beta-propeller fold lactonase family protein, partial [Cyclobacteriaceae bacterium]